MSDSEVKHQEKSILTPRSTVPTDYNRPGLLSLYGNHSHQSNRFVQPFLPWLLWIAESRSQNQYQNPLADLAEIVAVWPELPEHIKAAIKALIQTHNK